MYSMILLIRNIFSDIFDDIFDDITNSKHIIYKLYVNHHLKIVFYMEKI